MTRRLPAILLVTLLIGGCAEIVTDILEYGSVVVEARRRSGDPVPGAPLRLYTGSRVMAVGTTGANGTYLFEHIPPDVFGVYAEPPDGYARPEEILGGPSTAYLDNVLDVEEGEQRTAAFTFVKIGPGSISVDVTQPDGTPISGIPVTLYRPQGAAAEGISDDQGSVRFGPVPFGAWGISLYPPDEYLEMNEVPPFLDGIPIEEGSEESVSFTLERCEGNLEARVTQHDGTPVAGYPIQLYNADGDLEEGVTGTDGLRNFGPLLCREFGLRLGRLEPWVLEEGRGKAFFDGIRVSRGSLQAFSFEVGRCAGTISVRVQDAQGVPLPGAGLTFYTAERVVSQSVTDGLGAYSFSDAGCGIGYGVSVQPPPGYSVAEGRGSSFFDGIVLQAGEKVSLTFQLTAG